MTSPGGAAAPQPQTRSTTGQPGAPGVSSRRILFTLTAVALGMGILGAVLFFRYVTATAGDPRRIAVAPFDLPDAPGAIATWRVGLAAGLTARLATGGWETVPQPDVARLWRARTTPMIAAVELARRSAAGIALYGRVDRGPADSLVVRAALIDAGSTRGMFEVAAALPPSADVGRAADTLAALLLAGLAAQ